MKIGFSNIAWEPGADGDVAAVLQEYGVGFIDIAPGKYFPEPEKATECDILAVKKWWAERGIAIFGMQSLLFGQSNLNLFKGDAHQAKLIRHLSAIARIAGIVGAKRLTFGSPKNRDRTGLDDKVASDIAADFFYRLGQVGKQYGVVFCLEPSSTIYGGNFLTDSVETLDFVRRLGHPCVMMQLDTGAMTISGETDHFLTPSVSNWVGHIHISEPGLVPVGHGQCDHRKMADMLGRYFPNRVATIEMIAGGSTDCVSVIADTLSIVTTCYNKSEA